jgi:hypothetical protein
MGRGDGRHRAIGREARGGKGTAQGIHRSTMSVIVLSTVTFGRIYIYVFFSEFKYVTDEVTFLLGKKFVVVYV